MAYLEDFKGYDDQLREFKDRVRELLPALRNDFMRGDMNLFKFLVARDFDVNKAEELFRKHVEWRQTNNINQILDIKIPDVVLEAFPYFYSGVDKRGHPIFCNPVGRWKVRKVCKREYEPEIKNFYRRNCERLLEICREFSENGDPIYQYTTIFDMEGFDYTQMFSADVIHVCKEIVQEYFDNYPELPCAIRIVNAPKLFQIVWSMLEPMLTGRTLSKIEIYGTNGEQWKPKMLELIEPDNLSSMYGGAVTCFDYRVEYGINAFPRVVNLPPEDFKDAVLSAGQKHKVSFQLNLGDELAWNFKTEVYDIGFEVVIDDEKEPIVHYCRVDSHKLVQKGHVLCKQKGNYTLVFDNSYSKFKSKALHYAVQLTRKNQSSTIVTSSKIPDRSPA